MSMAEINKYLVWSHLDISSMNMIEMSEYKETPFPEVDINNKEATIPKIKEFFDKNYTCNAKGKLDITKVTGQLNF